MQAVFHRSALFGMVCAALLTGCSKPAPEKNQAEAKAPASEVATKSVAITAIVEHPALDSVREGAVAQLAENGFKENENLKVNFQSAQGNTATAGQIAKQFVGDNPDVIIAIATPSAQSVVAATKKIPVVFSAVTDPVEAKLVPSWEASGTNVTGLSDMLPLEPQIELMKKVVPNLKSVGYVYSPGEVNSTVVLKELETKLKPMSIEVVAVPAQRTTDIPMAARSLKGKVDLIYTSLDNNVVSAYESLYQVAKEIKVPLVAADTDSVKRGAVAALGVNYYELGKKTGQVATRILQGEKPGEIKPVTVESLDLYVSPTHASEQGITLPDALIKEAKEVIENAAAEKAA